MLAACPMEGRIALAFLREPNFFAAAEIDGEFSQVIVGRDRANGRIAGLGMRSISPRFVNGHVVPVGYLSALRVLPEYRRQAGLVARGYRYLKHLHEDGRTPFYLTTIASDNETALRTIVGGRAGLPRYEPLGNFITLAINPARVRPHSEVDRGVVTRVATNADRSQIVQYLRTHGPRRQFFPSYTESDLFASGGALQGLRAQDVVLALQGDRIVGVLGAWVQSSFKQVMVSGYSTWLQLVRPCYNVAARVRGMPQLPRPGEYVQARYGAIPVVAGDDGAVFQQLLGALCTAMRQRRQPLLLLGFHERDPLLSIAQAWPGTTYVTRLYRASWPKITLADNAVRQGVPYLELGAL